MCSQALTVLPLLPNNSPTCEVVKPDFSRNLFKVNAIYSLEILITLFQFLLQLYHYKYLKSIQKSTKSR
nr:MAG TPA: hypothetical protein [Caudoviricetes sp.]DAV45055.1 MAG TPA: hypothetical protein [Caudoviricetes sp.]